MIKLQRNLFEGDGELTQGFGEHPEWYAKFGLEGHNGIDYGIPTGRKLYSCVNGKVIEAQLDKNGYGNYVKIENDVCGVLYGHLKSFAVKVGDEVGAGQVIGLSDNTGNSTGPHLHFGVFPKPRDRANGYAGYINPLDKNLIEWVDKLQDEKDLKIESLEKELDEIRASRNKWKADYKTLQEESEKREQDLIIHRDLLQKDLSEANAQIEILKKAIMENRTPLSAYTVKERLASVVKSLFVGGDL